MQANEHHMFRLATDPDMCTADNEIAIAVGGIPASRPQMSTIEKAANVDA
jgi:hypothetical protein